MQNNTRSSKTSITEKKDEEWLILQKPIKINTIDKKYVQD